MTTAIQAQANAIKLEAFLTSAAAATDMCATAESNGQGIGKLFFGATYDRDDCWLCGCGCFEQDHDR